MNHETPDAEDVFTNRQFATSSEDMGSEHAMQRVRMR